MKILRQLSLSFVWLAAACLSVSAMAQTPPPGTITYIHNDLLGSPAAATNATGVVIWREAYSGYGERLKNEAGATANKVWYTSRHQDEETGLVYMGARYYDPALGRFLSVDSVGFNETNSHRFNRYSYANDNPYRFKDPDGNSPEDFLPKDAPILAIGRAIGGLTALGVGAATGNTSLMSVASAGLAEGRQENIEAGLVLATMGRGGKAPSGVVAKRALEPVYKTTAEATAAAKDLGFTKIKETVHDGQAVYKRGDDFITRDIDGHIGGAWKMADSAKNLGSKVTRTGTFSADLKTRLGD